MSEIVKNLMLRQLHRIGDRLDVVAGAMREVIIGCNALRRSDHGGRQLIRVPVNREDHIDGRTGGHIRQDRRLR